MTTKTQIFDYNDDNQALADMMLEIVKHGKADTPYDLLELGIFNKEEYYKDSHAKLSGRKTFVEFSVTDLFHEKYNQKPVDFDTFWKDDKILAHRAPHWNRKVVTVKVYNTIEYNDKQYNIVTLNTWFSQKNKSYTDLCLGTLFFEPAKLRDGVHAEWNQRLCDLVGEDEWKVDDNTFRNILSGVLMLSKQLKDSGEARLKELETMLHA